MVTKSDAAALGASSAIRAIRLALSAPRSLRPRAGSTTAQKPLPPLNPRILAVYLANLKR